MSLFSRTIARLRGFRTSTEGYASVEAVIVLPVLLWIFGVGWVYFDVFRQQSVNQKANYTIGDMLSREVDPITTNYMDSAYELLKLLNKAQTDATDLRITVTEYQAGNDAWRVVWSETRGDQPVLTDADLPAFADRLPVVTDTSQLILVETWDDYDPAFEVGLGAFEIKTYSFTQPRYAPQVLRSDGSSGAGGTI